MSQHNRALLTAMFSLAASTGNRVAYSDVRTGRTSSNTVEPSKRLPYSKQLDTKRHAIALWNAAVEARRNKP